MLPTRETVIQEGDLLHLVMREENAAEVYAVITKGPGGALMSVAIAGAGAVGRSVAQELITNGHQVLLIDKDPVVDQARPGAGGRVAAGRLLRAVLARGGPARPVRRGDRRHR